MSDRMFAAAAAPAPTPAPAPAPTGSGPIVGPALPAPPNILLSIYSARRPFLNTALTIMFYTSITLFVLFLLLTFIHYTMYPIFSFSEDEPGLISVPTASDKQMLYTKGPAMPDMSANLVSIPGCTYTIAMDIYLSGNFQTTTAPRVLLYRSIHTPVAPSGTDTPETVLTRYPDTNILVWLDPMKNDINVSAVYATTTAGSAKKLATVTAENIPIRKPFRLTYVYTREFLELYINGKLEASKPLTMPPLDQDSNSYFFPVPKLFSSNVMIGHLTAWPRALSAREVKANGTPVADATFFTKPN